jgi:hypothetical protein
VANIEIVVFWDVTVCNLVYRYLSTELHGITFHKTTILVMNIACKLISFQVLKGLISDLFVNKIIHFSLCKQNYSILLYLY